MPVRSLALALCAALWHDIGRRHDGMEPRHGFRSVLRADKLGLFDTLLPDDADLVRFAITWRSTAPPRGAWLASAPLPVTKQPRPSSRPRPSATRPAPP